MKIEVNDKMKYSTGGNINYDTHVIMKDCPNNRKRTEHIATDELSSYTENE